MKLVFRTAAIACALGLVALSCGTSDEQGVATPVTGRSTDGSEPARTTENVEAEIPEYEHPMTLDNIELQAAFDRLLDDAPAVHIVRERTTIAGRSEELVSTDGYLAPDRTSGHTSFEGVEPITLTRAAGNAELGELLLSEGVSFVAIDDVLHFDRAVAVAWSVGVGSEGSAMVSVRLDDLNELERFVVELFAPFIMAPSLDEGDPFTVALVGTDSDGSQYEGVVNDLAVTLGINDEGQLVELNLTGPGAFGPESTFAFGGKYNAVARQPEDVSTRADEDVTEALKEYVRLRSADPQSTDIPNYDADTAPFLLAGLEPQWVDGWSIDLEAALEDGVQLGSVSDDRVVLLNDGFLTYLWDLRDGAIRFVRKTAQALRGSHSSIALARPTSCTVDTIGACGQLRGLQLVDTLSGEMVALPDGRDPLVLSGDGTTLWVEGPALDGDFSQVDWTSGARTDVVSLDESLGVVREDFAGATLVAVSIDGQRALFVPPTNDDDRREFQLSAVDADGTITPVLPTGSRTFTGGAALSEDGMTALLGTSTGLALFDFTTGEFVATDVACDDLLTLQGSSKISQRVIEIEPGRWLTALTPSKVASREPAVVFLVEPAARSCDRIATIVSPPDEGLYWVSLFGSPGSAVVGLATLDDELGGRYEVIVDLDARPPGGEVIYEDGQWSAVGPAG